MSDLIPTPTDYPPHDHDWIEAASIPAAEAPTLSLEVMSLEALDLLTTAMDYATAIPLTHPGTEDLRLLIKHHRDHIDGYHPRTYRTDYPTADPYHVLDYYTSAVRLNQRARTLHAAHRASD